MKTTRAIALAIVTATLALAQTKQAMDEEYARLVKEWTTAPEFMSPLVDHLPKAPGVPTTKDVLGYYVGAPKKLTRTADLGKYYRALAAASKRVKLMPIGTTDEGRECLVVAIADEETIRNLDTYKARLARLADPRGLSPDQAQQIDRRGQADLHVHRRPALRRNRTAGDADGTGLPARRGRIARSSITSART